MYLGGNLITWRSKKQPTLSKYSTKVELGLLIQQPVHLYCDSVSASYLVVNSVHHDRCQHIKIDYHFVCDSVAHGDLVVHYVPIKLQIENIFTKSLSSQCFEFVKSNLYVISPVLIEGGVIVDT